MHDFWERVPQAAAQTKQYGEGIDPLDEVARARLEPAASVAQVAAHLFSP